MNPVIMSYAEMPDTPAWIAAWCAAHDGGWYSPMALSAKHPLVVEQWKCFTCGEGFTARETALVMPFAGHPGGPRWVADHRECAAGKLFEQPAQRALARPSDYLDLDPREQWEIDKRLGVLDWKGE